jgi:Domain of unknown function (DUF4134)
MFMKKMHPNQASFWKTNQNKIFCFGAFLLCCLLCNTQLLAQVAPGLSQGLNSLEQNATTLKTTGKRVCYSVAIIAALIGAVRVIGKQSGERENLHKEIAGWFGGAVFFAVAGYVVDTFMTV